jgi:hypothetical protein
MPPTTEAGIGPAIAIAALSARYWALANVQPVPVAGVARSYGAK